MTTEVMQITVPTELAEQIRERVRSGEFASESDVVIDRFHEDEEMDLLRDEAVEDFRLGAEALDEMERHPESVLTHEQVWSKLDAHRAVRHTASS